MNAENSRMNAENSRMNAVHPYIQNMKQPCIET